MSKVLVLLAPEAVATSDRPRAASLLTVLLLSAALFQTAPPSPVVGSTPNPHLVADFVKLPLSFEENRGRLDEGVRYMARGDGFTLYLTDDGPRFTLAGDRGAHLAMNVLGANREARIIGEDKLPGVVNYLKGDASTWHTNVPTFAAARYEEILAGTDLVFYGSKQRMEFDFALAPGADPDEIVLDFVGADELSISKEGELDVATAAGSIRFDAPNAYQDIDGRREGVGSSWTLENGRAAFDIGSYDETLPLVIDPLASLSYSTFLGGSDSDNGNAIAVDAAGDAYVTGNTVDAGNDLPTTTGAFNTTHNGSDDVFVVKLDASGAGLVYSTFLGGSGGDFANGIAVDGAGNAYVTGSTDDDTTDLPTTPGAFDAAHNGVTDAFVAKLNASGSELAYSTLLGGSSVDTGFSIAVDSAGDAYVTGRTFADTTDLPTTSAAYDTSHNGSSDVFVAKFNASGSGLAYSTFLGGSGADLGTAIALDGAGNAYVTGSTIDAATDLPTTAEAFDTSHNGSDDSFVAKLDASGSALAYSTFLGGSGVDQGSDIVVDTAGNASVTGGTLSAGMPTTLGAFDTTHNGGADAFVAKLDASGSGLVYSTFLGGGDFDRGAAIAVDGAGNYYVTGLTTDALTDLPATGGAFDSTHNGGADAFITELNASGSTLAYSTFLGGSGFDSGAGIAIDGADNAYVTGSTDNTATDLPTTPLAFDTDHNGVTDAFVAKFAPPSPSLSINDVKNREGDSRKKSFTFTVSASFASSNAITADFATAKGTAKGKDFVATAGTLTIPAGQTTGQIVVKVKGDTLLERNEKFFVNLSNAQRATIADGQGRGTIKNDD